MDGTLLESVVKFSNSRVKKYGAPCISFALVSLLNHIVTYILKVYSGYPGDNESLLLRLLAAILSLGLLFKAYWPKKAKRYLPMYWYVTLTFSLPILLTYLLLQNNFSLGWLMNVAIGLLVLSLVLDWLMFIISLSVGALIGISLFFIQGGAISLQHIPVENIYLASYMYLMIFVFVVIFARNREMHAASLLQAKVVLAKKLEEEIVKKHEDLAIALKAKSDFLNNVNHEIRTPINSIRSICQGLVRDWNILDTSRRNRMLGYLIAGSESLFNIANNMLDLAKINANQLVLNLEPNNLVEVVKEAMKEVEWLASEKKATMKLTYDESVNSAFPFDKERITQVLRNLLTNALKYGNMNGEVNVSISEESLKEKSAQYKKAIRVSVRDKGVGIPQEELGKVFQAFVQSTKTSSKAGGIGLGLALAADIVHKHGGQIWAQNNEGGVGTTFSFKIPCSKDAALEIQHDEGEAPRVVDKNIKVLFIDDEPANCAAMEFLMRALEYTNLQIFSGALDAIEYLKEHASEVDLIFVDLTMPEMNGFEFLKEVKSHNAWKKIPVITQSGITNAEEINLVFSLGAASHLPKPYGKEEVEKHIKLALFPPKSLQSH